MNKLLLVFLLLVCCQKAICQKVNLITVDQLNDRISKGKDTVFVINFWATWCKPCKKELPYFIKLQNEYAQKQQEKLKMLLVSVDFKSVMDKRVIPYLKKIKKEDDLFLLDEKSEQDYIDRIDKNWSGALPATLFIKAGQRRFFETGFTYPELVTAYKSFQ